MQLLPKKLILGTYSGSGANGIRFTDVWYVELHGELADIVDIDNGGGGGGAGGGACCTVHAHILVEVQVFLLQTVYLVANLRHFPQYKVRVQVKFPSFNNGKHAQFFDDIHFGCCQTL